MPIRPAKVPLPRSNKLRTMNYKGAFGGGKQVTLGTMRRSRSVRGFKMGLRIGKKIARDF